MATLYTVAAMPMSSLVSSHPLTPLSGPENDFAVVDYQLADIDSVAYHLLQTTAQKEPQNDGFLGENEEFFLPGMDASQIMHSQSTEFSRPSLDTVKSKLSMMSSDTFERVAHEAASPTAITTASSATSLPSPPASAAVSAHVSPEISRQVSAANLGEWVLGGGEDAASLLRGNTEDAIQQLLEGDIFGVQTPCTAPSSPVLVPTPLDLRNECPDLDLDDYLVGMGTASSFGESLKVSPSSEISFQSSNNPFQGGGVPNSTVFDIGLIGSMQLITDYDQVPSALITPPQSSGAQELDYFYRQQIFTTAHQPSSNNDSYAPVTYMQPFFPSMQSSLPPLDSSFDSNAFFSMPQNHTLFMPTSYRTSPQDLRLSPMPTQVEYQMAASDSSMYQPTQTLAYSSRPQVPLTQVAPPGKMPISKSPYHSGAYLSKSVVPTSVPQPQANVRNTKSTATSFPCPFPECNKVFQQKFNLKSHLRSHATERAYQCNMCEAAFRRSHDLKRHHRSLHTQVKPFGCDLCDKRFSRMDALKRHTRRHMDGDVSD